MTEGQNTKKTQIIRKDGKDCLMEVNTQAFSIGKVKLVFAKYDQNKPKGQLLELKSIWISQRL